MVWVGLVLWLLLSAFCYSDKRILPDAYGNALGIPLWLSYHAAVVSGSLAASPFQIHFEMEYMGLSGGVDGHGNRGELCNKTDYR